MNGEKRKEAKLTHTQRKLVERNLGLVALHIRRHVGSLPEPRRDREWEDLYQEGCLGLIQAAMLFKKDSGIPFAAFALPRIHNAVSRALHTKFNTVHVTKPRATHPRSAERIGRDPTWARRGKHAPDALCGDPASGGQQERDRSSGHDPSHVEVTLSNLPLRRIRSPSDDFESRPASGRRREADEVGRETIGQRLRGKYERAVNNVCDQLSQTRSSRGDRDLLVRTLVEERFMVPHEEQRRPLRRIARETRSSYARVAKCHRRLSEAVEGLLQVDPEFRELKRLAKADPKGVDVPIDEQLECDLAEASASAFIKRLHSSSPDERGRMLDALLSVSNRRFTGVVRSSVSRLPVSERERLAWEAAGSRWNPVPKSLACLYCEEQSIPITP